MSEINDIELYIGLAIKQELKMLSLELGSLQHKSICHNNLSCLYSILDKISIEKIDREEKVEKVDFSTSN